MTPTGCVLIGTIDMHNATVVAKLYLDELCGSMCHRT